MDFKDVPDWVQYKTRDLDGSVSYWECKPEVKGSRWVTNAGEGRHLGGGRDLLNPYQIQTWPLNSLIKRPTSLAGDYFGIEVTPAMERARNPKVEGVKFDADKPQYTLTPPLALAEVVKVLTFGAKKYAPDNWRKVDNALTRYADASMRHGEAVRMGETHDSESGLHHLAHRICCDLFRLELMLEGRE
jgi:hypothetical protein